MKNIAAKIVRLSFISDLGKTAIETSEGTVWANGNVADNKSTQVNITVNEVGDTFTATKDSSNGHFKAGDTVTRQKQSLEFKSFVPSVAEQFVAAAAERGVPVNFVIQTS